MIISDQMDLNIKVSALDKAREDAANLLVMNTPNEPSDQEVSDSELIALSKNNVSSKNVGGDSDATKKQVDEELELVFGPGAALIAEMQHMHGEGPEEEGVSPEVKNIEEKESSSSPQRGRTRQRESGGSPGKPSPSRPRLSSGIGVEETRGDNGASEHGKSGLEKEGGQDVDLENGKEDTTVISNEFEDKNTSDPGGTQVGS